MTKTEIIEYLYENHVHGDLKIEDMAEDLSESKRDSSDTIYRRDALEALRQCHKHCVDLLDSYHIDIEDAEARIRRVPSVQREPISEAYAKTVRNWLICYQLKCVELKLRYTPYEVLGWIVNDWGKEFGK